MCSVTLYLVVVRGFCEGLFACVLKRGEGIDLLAPKTQQHAAKAASRTQQHAAKAASSARTSPDVDLHHEGGVRR
jgi:hypothetical protein